MRTWKQICEEKRFYEHSGIDILRTAKATVSYLLHKTDGTKYIQ